jgi:hypothetical protein
MMNEEQRIALGLRPRTLRGFWFWVRYWSPPALAWWKWRDPRRRCLEFELPPPRDDENTGQRR